MTIIAATRQNKIDAVTSALQMLQRGVKEPTIVANDDGSFDAIPGAHLTDASYQGSRRIFSTVEADGFGLGFDAMTASEEGLQNIAEWAADEWDWYVIEEAD